MISKLAIKFIIGRVIKAITKADDKIIASNHEERIVRLESMAHPEKELTCKCCKKKEV